MVSFSTQRFETGWRLHVEGMIFSLSGNFGYTTCQANARAQSDSCSSQELGSTCCHAAMEKHPAAKIEGKHAQREGCCNRVLGGAMTCVAA